MSTTTARPRAESRAFAPDNLPDPSTRPFSMEIEGEPDMGKTHFLSTFPKGLILDSELKADIVLKKAPEKGHVWKKVSSWLDLRGGVDWALGQPEIKTIAIDSGADIREFALEEWRRRTGKTEPVAYIDGVAVPLLWAQVYDLIDTLTGDVQRAGRYFVVTARMEDEYVANVKTGRRVRDRLAGKPFNTTSKMIKICPTNILKIEKNTNFDTKKEEINSTEKVIGENGRNFSKKVENGERPITRKFKKAGVDITGTIMLKSWQRKRYTTLRLTAFDGALQQSHSPINAQDAE